jgi:hypothetical protein
LEIQNLVLSQQQWPMFFEDLKIGNSKSPSQAGFQIPTFPCSCKIYEFLDFTLIG